MKSCLIVYYSRTGVTNQAALALARECGADVEVLQPLRPYRNAGGFLRAAWEAEFRIPAPISTVQRRPSDYPFIVLGTPVWAGHMSAPMRTYIMQQRQHFHRVSLFCTMGGRGGRGGENTLDEMAALCHKAPIARLCLREQEVRTGHHVERLQALAAELGRLEPAPPAFGLGFSPI
ncbi:MAG: flavodoxin [Janthinobacterium sp.]|jgi:flavodoxin